MHHCTVHMDLHIAVPKPWFKSTPVCSVWCMSVLRLNVSGLVLAFSVIQKQIPNPEMYHSVWRPINMLKKERLMEHEGKVDRRPSICMFLAAVIPYELFLNVFLNIIYFQYIAKTINYFNKCYHQILIMDTCLNYIYTHTHSHTTHISSQKLRYM